MCVRELAEEKVYPLYSYAFFFFVFFVVVVIVNPPTTYVYALKKGGGRNVYCWWYETDTNTGYVFHKALCELEEKKESNFYVSLA